MKKKLVIALGSDHGGFQLKTALISYLKSTKSGLYEVLDLGAHQDSPSVDYPHYAQLVVRSIQHKQADLGVLCCGTGIGMSIAANRYPDIRAALVHNDLTATMARAHNNANVLCLGGRVLDEKTACRCVGLWLETPYEGGRHATRLALLGPDGSHGDANT